MRTFAHATVEELARYATIPIINALSDAAHPCQAMADLMTIQEALGPPRRRQARLRRRRQQRGAVAGAWPRPCSGVEFVLAAPPGYEFPADFRARVRGDVPRASRWSSSTTRARAVAGADVVYTDVWASMGQEHEAEQRRDGVRAVSGQRRRCWPSLARDAIFLHCLPAHRGEEVTSDVLDGPRSLVIPQAANRLHFQKALLIWLMLECWPEGLGHDVEPRLHSQSLNSGDRAHGSKVDPGIRRSRSEIDAP